MNINIKIALGFISFAGLSALSYFNVLLFHTLAEITSVVIAITIFVIAWNSREFNENHFLGFIGVAYLFVGTFDLFHAISYKNMGVFTVNDSNLPTQFWIIARYIESISILLGLALINRQVRYIRLFASYLSLTALLFILIFHFKAFPDCFIEGKGLTTFKIYSEYLISLILAASIFLLVRLRAHFDRDILRVLIASIMLTIVSEILFTYYISVFGISNILGHAFKLASFFLIYYALIETGFRKPFSILFKELSDHRDELEDAVNQKDLLNKEIHHRVKNNLIIMTSLLRLQEKKTPDSTAKEALVESRNRINAISMLHEFLYRSADAKTVHMRDYVHKLVKGIASSLKAGEGITQRLEIEPVDLDVNIAVPVGLIINELMTNSLKYACIGPERCEISVSFRRNDERGYTLLVKDNGKGLPDDFDIEGSDSFGLNMVSTLVEQLDGNIAARNDNGAEFLVTIPQAETY